MKHCYLFLVAFLPFFGAAQQKAQLGVYFTCDIPNHGLMPKMSTNPGLGLQAAFRPMSRFPMSIEVKGSVGVYSSKTLQQTYVFSDSSSTTTDVTYSSTMSKYLIGTKFHIGSEYKAVRGFITPQIGGATMRTKIAIADPQDTDGCEPLERETKKRFSGFVYGAEIGAEVSMSRLFRGEDSENRHRLFISASYLSGFKDFEYVNVKYMEDHSHHIANGGETTMEDGREITTQFINLSNNNIHEHKIAELYKTSFQFFGFNVGYVFNF